MERLQAGVLAMEESIPLIYDIGVAIAIFITIYRTIVYICKADGISGDTVDFSLLLNIYEEPV